MANTPDYGGILGPRTAAQHSMLAQALQTINEAPMKQQELQMQSELQRLQMNQAEREFAMKQQMDVQKFAQDKQMAELDAAIKLKGFQLDSDYRKASLLIDREKLELDKSIRQQQVDMAKAGVGGSSAVQVVFPGVTNAGATFSATTGGQQQAQTPATPRAEILKSFTPSVDVIEAEKARRKALKEGK